MYRLGAPKGFEVGSSSEFQDPSHPFLQQNNYGCNKLFFITQWVICCADCFRMRELQLPRNTKRIICLKLQQSEGLLWNIIQKHFKYELLQWVEFACNGLNSSSQLYTSMILNLNCPIYVISGYNLVSIYLNTDTEYFWHIKGFIVN